MQGMLVFFGCNIGSCHVCLCSTCHHGALTSIVDACVMHDEAKDLLVFLDAVLSHVILMFC
jgi:heterodisulfide reductase subunit B